MSEKGLHAKLIDIQQNLKAPKSEYNEFGGFAYRNIESIEQAVKPLLKEHGLTLRFVDDIVAVGTRVYVKSTAILSDGENKIENTAYAREAESKTKMDDSQLTGASSSYARKYAAGGLFLIDNEKDADSMNNTKESKPKANASVSDKFATMKQVKLMIDKAKWGLKTYDKDEVMNFLLTVLGKEITQIKSSEVDEALQKIDKALREVKVTGELEESLPDKPDEVITDLPDEIDLDNIPY